VQALHTLRDLLCIVQQGFSSPQKHVSSETATAEQDARVAKLVNSLAVQADEVCTPSISVYAPWE
jgi:hypothetical protein